MKEWKEKLLDLIHKIKTDPKAQLIFCCACSFVIGLAVGNL